MGVSSALLALWCALAALPVNLGAQQQLVVDAGRLQHAMRVLNVSDPGAASSGAPTTAAPVFPDDTAPAEMLLKCKTTCAFDGPNMTHSSNASTCVRCLDRTASDIIDRVIATQERLTSFRIKTRADRGLYSRKEEASLTAAHEAAVLQLRSAVAPAQPPTSQAGGASADGDGGGGGGGGGSGGSGSSGGSAGAGQVALLKAGESAKMKQTSSRVLDTPSAVASAGSASASASSSSPPFVFFSPRQECYRVCGNPGDVNHDEQEDGGGGGAAFVEVGSTMLAEDFASMGTMEQCIRLCVRITKNTVTKLAAAAAVDSS